MECTSGVEWSGVEWSGVEWNVLQWSKMEQSGLTKWLSMTMPCRYLACHAQGCMLLSVIEIFSLFLILSMAVSTCDADARAFVPGLL